MAANKRTKAQRENDLVFIADLYVKGTTHADITAVLNAQRPYKLSRSQISRDISTIHLRWIEQAITDYDRAMHIELQRINRLEREYWDAWEQSKRDKGIYETTLVEDNATGKDGESTQGYNRKLARRRMEQQYGEVNFLKGIERCIEQRCRILGLDAPERFEVDWRVEATSLGINPDELYKATVQQIVEAMEKSQINYNTPPALPQFDEN